MARCPLRILPPTPDDHDEHARTYGVRGVRLFELRPLNERVLAGPQVRTAVDAHELTVRGVTHVLDLRQQAEWVRAGERALLALEQREVLRKSVPMLDAAPPTPEQLDEAVAWLAATLVEPQARVMVHCRAGIERTGTVLAAWMVKAGLDLDDALAVLAVRCRCQPMPAQAAAVRAWAQARR